MRRIKIHSILIRLLCSIYLSQISFSQWELRYPDIPSDQINDITFIDEATGFIVNSGGSILMTTDGGASWKITSHYQRNILSEIKFVDNKHGFVISPYSHMGDNVSFIYTSDGGLHWQQGSVLISDALTFLPLSMSLILKSSMYSGTIQRLDNFFGNWNETYRIRYFFDIDVPVPYGEIIQFQRLPSGRILALGNSGNARKKGILFDSVSFILSSDNDGGTWDTLWCDLPYVSQTFIFSSDSVGWLGAELNGIYKTTDGGVTWSCTYLDSTQKFSITSLSSSDGIHVFAVDGSGRIIRSSNSGTDWEFVPVTQYNDYRFTIKFLNSTKGFLVGPVFKITEDGGTTWNDVSKSLKGSLFKIDFANARTGIGVGGNFIYKTTDGGHNWEIVYENSRSVFSYVDMVDSLHIWVTGYDSIYKSSDGGSSWLAFKLNNTIQQMRGVEFLNNNVGIIFEVWEHTSDTTFNYITTDGGNSWEKHTINNQPFMPSFFKIKFTDPNHLWFANQYGVWLSRDTGKTWTLFPLDGSYQSFDFIDSSRGWVSLWGGQFKKMAFTTNGGSAWKTVEKPYSIQTQDVMMYDYFGSLNILAAGLEGSLIRFIQDDPFTYEIPTYTTNTMNSFASYKSGNVLHLWVAGNGMVVLHDQFLVTDVSEQQIIVPELFSLSQNYPNPFNPSTTIEYRLPRNSFVTLKLYDVLGREVATLVNEEMNAGMHKATWNAAHVSSGIYFARMTAGQFSSTKKLLLTK